MDDHKFRNISFEINDQKLFIVHFAGKWMVYAQRINNTTELLPGFVTSIDSKLS